MIMYKKIKNNDFEEIFDLNERQNKHNLRNFSTYKKPKIKSELGKRSINYYGIQLWEELPIQLNMINNERKFKTELKKWLMTKQTLS